MRSVVTGLLITSALVVGCVDLHEAPAPDVAPLAAPDASADVAVRACTDSDNADIPPSAASAEGLFDQPAVADTADAGADARGPLAAPGITLTAAGRARFAALPARESRVPVLLFHQVCQETCGPDDTYGTTQAELMRMMLVVRSAGYTTISIADYVRAMQGEVTGLPARPLLVTFDDGRLDAYRGADDVLRMLGARATMYILTAELDRNPAFRMLGGEVDAALASGRWDIQLHAHAGHVKIRAGVDQAGAAVFMPFYASRAYRAGEDAGSSGLESFPAWKVRAEEDVKTGLMLLAARTSDEYASLTFAVPFGNYGQGVTNDPAIKTAFRSFLDARFAVWFTQPKLDPDFTSPSHGSHESNRLTIFRTTTADMLYAWLARHARVGSGCEGQQGGLSSLAGSETSH